MLQISLGKPLISMKTSPTIGIISAALHRAQGTIGAASKDAKNPFFSSTYADLGSVMAVCKEPLLAQGISVLQPIDTREDGSIVLETILLHESGEFVGSSMKISPPKRMVCPKADKEKFEPYLSPDPQAEGAAITYARRYALQALVFIPSVDDDAEWAAAALLNRPLPADTVSRTEEKIENLIEKTGEGTEEERKLAHEQAMKIEKRLQKQTPEGIAIAEYEAAHPEHKNKVSNARQVNGTWEFDIIESPAKSTKRKPATVVNATVTNEGAGQGGAFYPAPWREVICHVGQRPGKMADRTLGYIFETGPLAPKTDAQLQKVVAWFVAQSLPTSPEPKDQALWKAVQEANAAWKPPVASEPPKSTQTAKPEPEAPPAPASEHGWRNFIVSAKSLAFSGKKLGELDADEMDQVGHYLDKVAWETALGPQKLLKANFALALAEMNPGVFPDAGEPDHTRRLQQAINFSGLNRNDFMSEARKAEWIPLKATKIEEIPVEDAEVMLSDWATVVDAVKAAQP